VRSKQICGSFSSAGSSRPHGVGEFSYEAVYIIGIFICPSSRAANYASPAAGVKASGLPSNNQRMQKRKKTEKRQSSDFLVSSRDLRSLTKRARRQERFVQ
jgi:3'-phosphoadenosine 5'-phosphosulfate (PAPS) 3'-phosphatase